MSQFEGRSYTHRKYRKPEVYRRKSIDVSKRPLPELHQNDRISNLWVANPFTLFVEGSLAELNSIIAMFKGKESPFGPIHEFKVYKYNSEQQPIIIWVKFTKEFQGSLLYKSISFFYQNELQGTKGFLRAFFAKNKFCYSFLKSQSCRKENCGFLHEEPNRARYYFEGDVINYVFDNQMANSIIEENIALIRKYHKHFSQGGMGKFNSAFQIISILELDKDPKVHDTSSQRRYSSDHEEFIKVERQNKSETVEEKILMKEQESEEELTEELIEDRRPSEAVCDLPDRNYLARIIKREGDQFIVDEFKELQEDIESLIRQEGLDDLQSNSSEFLGYRSSIRPKELKEKNNEYLLSNDDAPPEDSFGTIERQVVAFPQARVMFFWGVEFGSEDKTSSVFQDHLVLKEFLQEMEQKEEIPYQPSQTQTLSPGLNLQGSFSAGPLVIRNSDYRFLYFPNNEEEREFLNQLRLSETDHSQDECSYPKSPSNQAPEKTVFSENCEGKEHDKFRSFEIPLKKMMSTPPLYLLNELDIDQLDSKAGLVEFSTEKTREVKEEKINAVCIESEENPQLFVSKATKKKNRQVKKKEKKHAKQAADHPKMKKNSTVTESIDISEIQKGGNKAEEDSDEEKQLLFFINESKGNTEGKEPSGHQTGAQPKKDAIATKATNERPQEPQEEADKGSAVLKERTTVHTERLERSNSKNENESAAKEEEETTEKENIDQANDKKKKKRKKKKKKEAAELRLGPKLSSFQEQLLKAQSQEEQEARSPAKKASEELIQEKPEVAIAFQFAQQIREHARLGRDPIELVLGMLQRVDGCKVKGLKIELDADLKQENGLIRLIAEGENITSN